jgi:hypothetical protein
VMVLACLLVLGLPGTVIEPLPAAPVQMMVVLLAASGCCSSSWSILSNKIFFLEEGDKVG